MMVIENYIIFTYNIYKKKKKKTNAIKKEKNQISKVLISP